MKNQLFAIYPAILHGTLQNRKGGNDQEKELCFFQRVNLLTQLHLLESRSDCHYSFLISYHPERFAKGNGNVWNWNR